MPKWLLWTRRVPLLAWLVAALVAAVLLAWHGWRRFYLERRKRVIERRIQRTRLDYSRFQAETLTDNLALERKITEEADTSIRRLEAKRTRIRRAADSTKSTSDVINSVFNK